MKEGGKFWRKDKGWGYLCFFVSWEEAIFGEKD